MIGQTNKAMVTKTLTDYRIITIIDRIQKVYFALVLIGAGDLIFNLFDSVIGISEPISQKENLQLVINIVLFFFIYRGLRLREKWVIPLLLISSAWFLVSTFLIAIQPVVNILGLLSKFYGILFVLFFAYQMHFFSRREVRVLLGTTENIFF